MVFKLRIGEAKSKVAEGVLHPLHRNAKGIVHVDAEDQILSRDDVDAFSERLIAASQNGWHIELILIEAVTWGRAKLVEVHGTVLVEDGRAKFHVIFIWQLIIVVSTLQAPSGHVSLGDQDFLQYSVSYFFR